MKITFIGVGEACDSRYPNTSLLVETKGQKLRQFLLDCGFTTPHLYFKNNDDPDTLDCLWISHFHGDHFFGAPLLLLRLWEMGRKKPLLILGQEGISRKIEDALDLAYPGFGRNLHYGIDYLEIEPGKDKEIGGVLWRAAENEHSQRAFSLRIDGGNKSVFYSGDGRPTPETLALAKGCDLIVHEAFRVEADTPGHGSVRGAIEFAENAGAKQLALVHIERNDRKKRMIEIEKIIKIDRSVSVFLPEPGDIIRL